MAVRPPENFEIFVENVYLIGFNNRLPCYINNPENIVKHSIRSGIGDKFRRSANDGGPERNPTHFELLLGPIAHFGEKEISNEKLEDLVKECTIADEEMGLAVVDAVSPPTPDPHKRAYVGIGASYAAAFSHRDVDLEDYFKRLHGLGIRHTRIALMDTWAMPTGETGTYNGYLPWMAEANGSFNLQRFDASYFDRLKQCHELSFKYNIYTVYTLFNLYIWSSRKENLLWVPDMNQRPLRNNVNGIRWEHDDTFDRLPDWVLEEFMEKILDELGPDEYGIEAGNEMPEKEMHIKISNFFRANGFHGPLQVNRQEDTPGQYDNMINRLPGKFDKIAYHGKSSLDYLDEVYDDEPIHKTFRQFYENGDYEPSRIVFSTDGCRANNNLMPYNVQELLGPMRDALHRGFMVEHQLSMKMRPFIEGRVTTEDIELDREFIEGLSS